MRFECVMTHIGGFAEYIGSFATIIGGFIKYIGVSILTAKFYPNSAKQNLRFEHVMTHIGGFIKFIGASTIKSKILS